jgi:hypothetical protein
VEDLTVQGIIEEAEDRQSDQETANRFQQYKNGSDAYFNDYGSEGFRATFNDGRPALQDTQADTMRNELGPRARAGGSLIKSFVNDFVSIKGNLPLMTVDPEGAEEADFQTANDRTRLLQWVWDNSRMTTQFKRAAFYLSALGDAPITMDFLMPPKGSVKKDDDRYEGGMKPPGIYLTVSHPGLALPLFRTGVDMGELEDLILVEELPVKRARAKWPTAVASDETKETVMVYHVYTRKSRVTVVGETMVSKYDHNLGFCPAQWIKNSENGRLAQSDIEGILDAHAEYQIMRTVTNDALIQSVYPVTWIKDVQAFPDRLPTGPGAVVPMGPTGSIGQLQPAANAGAGVELCGQMLSSIEQMVGSAPVRTESSINHSNTSSRAVHAVQGPMEGRLASQQDVIGQHIISLNAKIMLAYNKLDEFKNFEIEVPTKGKDGNKKMAMTGSSFGGWWRNTVDWDAFAGSTRHERVVVALQLQGAEVVGKGFVAEQAGIRNADQEIKRAEAEAAAKMAQQQSAQGPPAGGPPGAGGPEQQQGAIAAPSDQGISLGAGGSPGGPTQPAPAEAGAPGAAPQGPDFPPVETPPTQQGAGVAPVVTPIGVEIQKIADQNQIELAGDAYELQDSIIVVLSNWKDSSRIKQLIKPIANGKKIVVQVKPKDKNA